MNQIQKCDLWGSPTFIIFCLAAIVFLFLQKKEGFKPINPPRYHQQIERMSGAQTEIVSPEMPSPSNVPGRNPDLSNRLPCEEIKSNGAGPLYSSVHEHLKDDPLHSYYMNPVIDVGLPGPTSPFDIPEGPGPDGVASELTETQTGSFGQLIDSPILIDSLVAPAVRTGHHFPGPVSEFCTKKHLEQNHHQFSCQAPGSTSEQIVH